MTASKSAVHDPIYITLVEARQMLISNFEAAKVTYGDETYQAVMEKLQEEHDDLLSKIDKRINDRIMTLAIEELSQ